MNTAHEQTAEFVRAAPPLTITSMTVLGFPMSDWVLLLTALYTLLQMALLVRRLLRKGQSEATTRIKDCEGRVSHDDER